MMMEIDTLNRFMVSVTGAGAVRILMPPRGQLDKEAALNLAAYLVALSDPTRERFEEVFEAITNV